MSQTRFSSQVQEVINRITEEKILELIKREGNTIPYKIKNKEIWFRTCCHGGDSHKLCYFRDSKEFYCYTNCGKMSLFDFFAKIRNSNFKETLSFLMREVGLSGRQGIVINNNNLYQKELSYLERKKTNRNKNKRKSFNETPIKPICDRIMTNGFFEDLYYEGWIDEGITIPSMEKYNIKWYGSKRHIIIPHYNINNELVGIRRRTLDENEMKKAKYMPEIIGQTEYLHSLGMNLYGLNITKEAIKKYKRAIIVEGEKSVLLSDSYFGDKSCTVATCGFTVSNWQRDMLLSLGVTEVVLAFDKDFNPLEFEGREIVTEEDRKSKEFDRFCDRLINIGEKFAPYCKTTIIWDRDNLLGEKNSPFDKGKAVFERLYSKREEIRMKDMR